MEVVLRLIGIAMAVWLPVVAAGPAWSACPSPEEGKERLSSLEDAGRFASSLYHREFPGALHQEALLEPGSPIVVRRSGLGLGSLAAELPVEVLWKALNDENHHDLDRRYVQVNRSEVIAGTPAGPSRLLFQSFKRFGIGRWWVSRVEMNEKLFADSEGGLWELSWQDEIETADRSRPPLAEVAEKMRPLQSSRGAWLLIPLGENCTLIEYYNDSEAGGIVSAGQFLIAKKAVRDTLEGLVRMAREHTPKAHPGVEFVRPDGRTLP